MFKDLMKLKKNAEFASLVPSLIAHEREREERFKEKLRREEAYRTSEEGIRENKLNDMLKKISINKNESIDMIYENCKSVSLGIVSLFEKELKKDSDKTIDFDRVEELINECMPILKKLREHSSNEKVVSRHNYKYTVYERMFNELILKDARFAYFAPKKCFDRTATKEKILLLDKEYKHKIAQRYKKLKEDQNADYVNEYVVSLLDSSPKSLIVSSMITTNDIVQTEVVKKMATTTLVLEKELEGFIKEEFLNKKEQGKVKQTDLNKIWSYSLNQRLELVKLSGNVNLKMSKVWKQSPHKELLEKTILTNPYFLISILEEYKERSITDNSLKHLDKNEVRDLLNIIIENKLNENPKFEFIANTYSEVFKDFDVDLKPKSV